MAQTQEADTAVEVVASGRTRATKAGVRGAPLAPGCYLFRDLEEVVLYVGKSVALRQRLASYFAAKRERKVRAMVSHAQSVEWLTVGSEVEALILESQLIKRFKPLYNVLGQEYPHYTFLRQEEAGGFPYYALADFVAPDGASHYGPFWGRRSAEQTLEFVTRLFQLRRCEGPLPSELEGKGCFYAQVRRCSAPCLGRIGAEDYAGAVRSAGELLRGDIGPLARRLEKERDTAAEQLRFERAAELHQAVLTLRTLQSKRRHLRSAANTINFLVVVRDPGKPSAQLLAFSAARLRGQMTVTPEMDGEQRLTVEQFILAHYPVQRPLAIDLDELDQMHVVAEWMARQKRHALYIPLPDGALTSTDAARAVEAVARALAE